MKKLYLWRDVFCDYTCGMAFGIADSKEEAIEAIAASDTSGLFKSIREDLSEKEPEVHELGTDVGAYVFGGA